MMDSYVHGEISELFGGEGSENNTLFASQRQDANIKKGKKKTDMSNKTVKDGVANKDLEGVDDFDVSSFSLPSKGEIERKERTIFIGNVPFVDKNVTKLSKHLKKFFKECVGEVEAIYLRNLPVVPGIPIRGAVFEKKFLDTKKSINAYIIFKDIESIGKALSLNGSLFNGYHLTITAASQKKISNEEYKHCIFLGNLPFDTEEEELWTIFQEKRKFPMEKVRLVRDRKTSAGLGYAFIFFKDKESVKRATQLEGKIKIRSRILRISRAHRNFKEKRKEKLERLIIKQGTTHHSNNSDRNSKKTLESHHMKERKVAHHSNDNRRAGITENHENYSRNQSSSSFNGKIEKPRKFQNYMSSSSEGTRKRSPRSSDNSSSMSPSESGASRNINQSNKKPWVIVNHISNLPTVSNKRASSSVFQKKQMTNNNK